MGTEILRAGLGLVSRIRYPGTHAELTLGQGTAPERGRVWGVAAAPGTYPAGTDLVVPCQTVNLDFRAGSSIYEVLERVAFALLPVHVCIVAPGGARTEPLRLCL